MPKKQIPNEGAEAGRHIGTLVRSGYGDLIEEVRVLAKAEGKTLTDKLAEVIKAGLGYEKYKELTLGDAMLVMDFIERAFNNFLYPVMYTSRSMIDQSELERIKTFAEYMGFIPREVAEKVMEERERQIIEALQKQQQEQSQEQAQQGPITTFIVKLAERLAETIGDEVVKRLISEGKLEDFLEAITNATKQAVAQTLTETALETTEQ